MCSVFIGMRSKPCTKLCTQSLVLHKKSKQEVVSKSLYTVCGCACACAMLEVWHFGRRSSSDCLGSLIASLTWASSSLQGSLGGPFALSGCHSARLSLAGTPQALSDGKNTRQCKKKKKNCCHTDSQQKAILPLLLRGASHSCVCRHGNVG